MTDLGSFFEEIAHRKRDDQALKTTDTQFPKKQPRKYSGILAT